VDGKKYTAASIGPPIENLLKRILKLAGFQLSFTTTEGANPNPDFENPEVVVQFSGSDVDLLLANKTELLLALEHLTMEMLRMPPEDHSKLCFDAHDHRMLRIEELRLSALTAAEKVKATRTPFRFNPMNSRERRILHLALRNESAVRSESAGFEPHRQVVIYPADMPSVPDGGGPSQFRRPQPPQRGRRR
jgi:spoIIIJ-associated protein